MAHGGSSSEGKLRSVLSEAKTHWTLFLKPEKRVLSEGKLRSVLSKTKTCRTLFRKPEKHVFFSTSSLARGAQQTTWRQRVQHEMPRKALGAKGYSTKCPKEHLAPKLPGLFPTPPVNSTPRAKRYGAKSAKKVRAKQYVTFLFGANLHVANIARTKHYSTNWSLVRFGLSRQTVRDFSKRTENHPVSPSSSHFLTFLRGGWPQGSSPFRPGSRFRWKLGTKSTCQKWQCRGVFSLKQKKYVFWSKKHAGVKQYVTFRPLLAGFA